MAGKRPTVAALSEFVHDVSSGAYPAPQHRVGIEVGALSAFRAAIAAERR